LRKEKGPRGRNRPLGEERAGFFRRLLVPEKRSFLAGKLEGGLRVTITGRLKG